MIPTQRDAAQTRETLRTWFEQNHPGTDIRIGELGGFAQGFSAELITFDLSYRSEGAVRTDSVVVRVEPGPEYQLFLDTNFEGQYRVLEALGRHTAAPVPLALGFEPDPAVLGARFFVMERVAGRTGQIGLDWMTEIGEEGRERLWWTGLEAMATMHRADPEALGVHAVLDQPHRGVDPIEQQLDYHLDFYDWVRGDERFPMIETAHAWLRDNKPAVLPPTGIVWGDARRGNQLFGSGLECTAILDFEQAGLGPAEVDLAWWLEGEQQTAQWMGFGTPSVEETAARYGQMLGREIADLGYYLVFASYRLAILRIKLSVLREGQPDRAPADAGIPRLAQVMAKWAQADPARL